MDDFSGWESRLYPSIIDNIQYIVDNVPENGVVYDVGANTGLLTMKVLEQRPDVKFFVFEPVKKYYEAIVAKFSGSTSVNYFNTALLDFDGEVDFSLSPENPGWNAPVNISHHGDVEKVPSRKLDTIISLYGLPNPDFIKVDVEQSEHLFKIGRAHV